MNPSFFSRTFITCADCRFWQITPHDLSQGACRRYPPKVFLVQANKGLTVMSAQPTTGRDLGCAEGEPKVVQ
jgi:hypothetical protein